MRPITRIGGGGGWPNSTGYGLPNAMRKIKAHGGQIMIDSRPGGGTIVAIQFPASGEGPNA